MNCSWILTSVKSYTFCRHREKPVWQYSVAAWKIGEANRETKRPKRLRAQRPCDRCALFQLCRKVSKASRLNLECTIDRSFRQGKSFLKVSLWKAVHDCAKVAQAHAGYGEANRYDKRGICG